MSSSGLSELTSDVSTDEEVNDAPPSKGKLDHYFKNTSKIAQAPPPLKKKRPPSPHHEPTLEDNPDIAVSLPTLWRILLALGAQSDSADLPVKFIVMFRSRFSDVFPKSLPHYGPQDIENGVNTPVPGEQVERLLCALLGLVLNRKKDVEKGHYGRALEDAIHSHSNEWPTAWQSRNPLHGGGSFNNMTAEQRLILMKTLIIWALESSEGVKGIIKESYKQSRHDDDLNQPLSVQPWGRDGSRRRFWLIEGQDDTHFRLYRESNPARKQSTWRNIAGTIEELRQVADSLVEDNTQAARRLRDRIMAAIPRFEAGEEKRRRRDYRLQRRQQFTRPEPGFSLYEGRTRGKRMKYTYSDEEGAGSDTSRRKSNRHSGVSTPAEPAAPRFTASGRQVRSRHGGTYGEKLLSVQQDQPDADGGSGMDVADDEDEEPVVRGRSGRPSRPNGLKSRGRPKKIGNFGSSEDSDHGSETPSDHEWDAADDDADDQADTDDDNDEDLDISEEDREPADVEDVRGSLVVRLHYGKGASKSPRSNNQPNGEPMIPQPVVPITTTTTISPARKDTQMDETPPTRSIAAPATQAMPAVNGMTNSTSNPHRIRYSASSPNIQSNASMDSKPSLPSPHNISSKSHLAADSAPPAVSPHAVVFGQEPAVSTLSQEPNHSMSTTDEKSSG